MSLSFKACSERNGMSLSFPEEEVNDEEAKEEANGIEARTPLARGC